MFTYKANVRYYTFLQDNITVNTLSTLPDFVILSHLSIMTDYYRQICHMRIILNSFSYHIHYNIHMNANVIADVLNSIMNDYMSTNVYFNKIHYWSYFHLSVTKIKQLPRNRCQGICNFDWLLIERCSVCYSKCSY